MKQYLVCVRDSGAQDFAQVQPTLNLGAAIRSFSDECNRPADNNLMYKHPQDFELYHIGHFDSDTGRLDPLPDPVLIARGTDAANKRPK